MPNDVEQNPPRDNIYFLEYVVFKVEGTLFQLPKHLFSESEVFSAAFTLPPAEGVDIEGSSEAHPIELLGISREDFRDFLQAIYPFGGQTHASMTVKQWISTLKLSDMWGFDKAKTLAIKMLQASKAVDDPIQKWLLGERYNVSVWTIDGCLKLVMRNEDGPQLDEVEKLGLPKALLVYKLREVWFKMMIKTMYYRPPDDGMRLKIREDVQRALEGRVNEDGTTESN